MPSDLNKRRQYIIDMLAASSSDQRTDEEKINDLLLNKKYTISEKERMKTAALLLDFTI